MMANFKILVVLVSIQIVLIFARPDIRKVYTPPSFGSTPSSTTPSYGITPPTSTRSYAVAAGGKAQTTPTPPPRKDKVTPTPAKITAATTSAPSVPRNLTFVLAARDLPLKKKGAKVDPYIKVTHRIGTLQELKEWAPVGQTETLKATNNPDFLSVFTFEWQKGKNQQWQFEVKGKHSFSKDEDLGKVIVKIDEYVEKGEDFSVKLGEPGAGGTLLVKKVQPIKFKLSARMVPKMDAFNGLSDPFVECYWRKGKAGNDTLFYTTKVIEDSENPDWNEIIEFQNYQNKAGLWFHFKVFDSDNVSGNDYIGDVLVEMDPFVQKRATVNQKIVSKDEKSKALLLVTPA